MEMEVTKESLVVKDEGSEWEPGNSEKAREEAAKNGWEVVVAKENQLQLDIDDQTAYGRYLKYRKVVAKEYGITTTVQAPSKSGTPGKVHVTLTLGRNVSPVERIALQSILGSDPYREIFSLMRWTRGDSEPTLLFEKPSVYLGSVGLEEE